MTLNKTLCVILHYGSEIDTNNCIESLLSEDGLDIVVADNDPSQSYKPVLKNREIIRIVKTGGLAGFSRGNNIGVDAFITNCHHSILILNNDTILTKNALNLLRSKLEDETVGAVGPCMPFADHPSKIWSCGGYINKLTLGIGGLVRKKKITSYEVDYLPGAAILCRSELWKRIGGFNESYFLAYEEAEFCMEIKKYGYKVVVEPRSIVLHKVGMSSQKTPEYFYNDIRNKIVFSMYLYGKRLGFLYGILITLLLIKGKKIKLVVRNFRLWVLAVFDQFYKKPLNRKVLQSIACRFGSFK